jgi:hypothetical protein
MRPHFERAFSLLEKYNDKIMACFPTIDTLEIKNPD